GARPPLPGRRVPRVRALPEGPRRARGGGRLPGARPRDPQAPERRPLSRADRGGARRVPPLVAALGSPGAARARRGLGLAGPERGGGPRRRSPPRGEVGKGYGSPRNGWIGPRPRPGRPAAPTAGRSVAEAPRTVRPVAVSVSAFPFPSASTTGTR